MHLEIHHRLEFRNGPGTSHALRRLRLCPQSGETQIVRNWRIEIEGATEEVRFSDAYGNQTRLIGIEGGGTPVAVLAAGLVETRDGAGMSGEHQGFVPLWLYTRDTLLTLVGERIRDLAESVGEGDDLARLHRLMGEVGERAMERSEPAETSNGVRDAETALAAGNANHSELAHIFIGAARCLGLPARYISGYRLVEEGAGQPSAHSWAEAYVTGLGWVGFDVEGFLCPDEHYVRLAIGRDLLDAEYLSGATFSPPVEELAVRVCAEQ